MKWAIVVVLGLLMSGASATVFSEDYRTGFAYGINIVGTMMKMDGILDGAYIAMGSMDQDFGDPTLGAFANEYVKTLAEAYNAEVIEYNVLVDDVNGIISFTLGDGAEGYKLEYQPLYNYGIRRLASTGW